MLLFHRLNGNFLCYTEHAVQIHHSHVIEQGRCIMKKYRILITDNIAQEGLNILLNDKAVEVDIKAGIQNDELKKIIGGYEAIITRSGTSVPASLI